MVLPHSSPSTGFLGHCSPKGPSQSPVPLIYKAYPSMGPSHYRLAGSWGNSLYPYDAPIALSPRIFMGISYSLIALSSWVHMRVSFRFQPYLRVSSFHMLSKYGDRIVILVGFGSGRSRSELEPNTTMSYLTPLVLFFYNFSHRHIYFC